ncbi:hypothetical protein K3G39_05820 [Pontibacter sp. HSC-14F20]|uniref:hypothetical protein n=1 Tax=Pontibacter sp. HSC-14F20 TaxID=2864136 RepID=UPI001C72F2B9|nr:hypothetical protein [Pontibacter sp. HSC-14F20]MBX0332749.1 hypothetical protein [Pontibacter sp. HSC-14F20]
MKLKFYAALISAMMLFSFASNAADVKSATFDKSTKTKKQAVSGNKTAGYFSFKSSAYKKDGLVKKKRFKKGSCPGFD